MSAPASSLDHALDYAGVGRWDYDPASGAVTTDAICRGLLGFDTGHEISRALVQQTVHEADRDRVFGALDALAEEGDKMDQVFRVTPPGGGQRWIRSVGRYSRFDCAPRVIGVSLDVTTEQELLAERALHLSEMNHRIKNLFALVSAMISSAAREASDKDDLVRNLRGRVAALDRAHSLMKKTDSSQPLELAALLEQVLAPARTRQSIEITGAPVLIPAEAVTSFVLILHEWVTNSAKYGALRQHDGAISVSWERTPEGIHLVWRETVEAYDEEGEKGFGSRLIQASAAQLGARKTRRFADGVLTIEMALPLTLTAAEPA
jgi:two-component system CheB/CheR fusion protein